MPFPAMLGPVSTTSFRRIAVAEAVSYLLLLVATAVKYGAGNEAGVKVLGPLHGLLVLAYVAGVFSIRAEQRWSAATTILVLVASAIPFGAFVVERRLLDPERAGS